MFLKKYQAIVFDSIDNIPQIYYVIAISKSIQPKNNEYISGISNSRFCIYLIDQKTVDLLIEKHQFIHLSEESIKIRRLINPGKRIISSKVSPSIPNTDIFKMYARKKYSISIPNINAGFNIK